MNYAFAKLLLARLYEAIRENKIFVNYLNLQYHSIIYTLITLVLFLSG